jgi:hypothetical protein
MTLRRAIGSTLLATSVFMGIGAAPAFAGDNSTNADNNSNDTVVVVVVHDNNQGRNHDDSDRFRHHDDNNCGCRW